MPTANYDKRLHFFTNDGKKELNVSCFHGLLNVQSQIREKQYIRVFLGFIELGVAEALQELEVVRIGGRGLSRFASAKIENRYLLIQQREFDRMISSGTSLEEILKTTLPEITFYIGNCEEKDVWTYYQATNVSKYLRYVHPLYSQNELQDIRDAEKRVIFWELSDTRKDSLWFAIEHPEKETWENRLNIENAEDLREACNGNKIVLAFLGDIQIGVVWYQDLEDIFLFGGARSGLGTVFPNGEDCFVLNEKQINAFLKRNISLEEFVHTAYSEFNGNEAEFEIMVADTAEKVWQCIQSDWHIGCRVKDIMCDTGYPVSTQNHSPEECRVVFVKKINR